MPWEMARCHGRSKTDLTSDAAAVTRLLVEAGASAGAAAAAAPSSISALQAQVAHMQSETHQSVHRQLAMTSHESTYAHSLLSLLLHNRLASFTLSHTPMRDDPLTACLAGQQTHTHPLALHPRAVDERSWNRFFF